MASRKRTNLTNAFSRSIESFFSVSNKKVDRGEAVQKKQKEADLDSEVENEVKKITNYFYCIHSDYTVCFITEDFLYCAWSLNLSLGALVLPDVNFYAHCRNFRRTAENLRSTAYNVGSVYFKRKSKKLNSATFIGHLQFVTFTSVLWLIKHSRFATQ